MKTTDGPFAKERNRKQYPDGDEKLSSTNAKDKKSLGGQTASPLHLAAAGAAETREEAIGLSTSSKDDTGGATNHANSREESQRHAHTIPRTKLAAATRVKMQGVQTKDFNYNRFNNKARRSQQIDDLDEQLRQEQESSRRLRSAVSVLRRKLDAAEEGRRRSNGLERAFFSHLAEVEALVLQRDRLVAEGNNETRAECIEAARNEAHKRIALVIRGELEENSPWRQHTWVEPEAVFPENADLRADDVHGRFSTHQAAEYNARPSSSSPATERTQKKAVKHHRPSPDRGIGLREGKGSHESPEHSRHRRDHLLLRPRDEDNEHCRDEDEKEAGTTATGNTCCWESDAVMQAYRTAAARTVRKLASALFGRELLAVEAAKTSAAERERMLEERAKALWESQVSLQVERDQLQSYKASLRAEVREAKAQLVKARKQNQHQQDLVTDAERIHSSLSWRILSMQVARDKLAEAVGERLGVIQAAVRRRVGFLPWAVERAVNDLVGLCAAAGPPSAGDGGSDRSENDKGLRLLGGGGGGEGASGSTSTSRSSSFRSSP